MPEPQIDKQTLHRVLACVHELSNVSEVEDFHAHALRSLRLMVDDDWIASEVFDRRTADWKSGLVDPEVPGDLYQLFQQRADENPMLDVIKNQARTRGVMTWAMVLGAENGHEALPIYHDFYRKLDIRQQAATFQALPDGTLLSHGFSRDGGYADSELAALRLVHPHLTHAYLNWLTIQDLKARPGWLAEGLEAVDTAVVLLDQTGQPRHWTPHAERLLNRYFCTTRRLRGALPPMLAQWLGPHLPRDPEKFVSPAPYRAQDPDGAAGTAAIEIRVNRCDRHEGYLLTITEQKQAPAAAQLQHRLGLTPRIAQLLHHLMGGKSQKQIATQMGLTYHTVRSYTKKLYQTMGVGSREALVTKIRDHLR